MGSLSCGVRYGNRERQSQLNRDQKGYCGAYIGAKVMLLLQCQSRFIMFIQSDTAVGSMWSFFAKQLSARTILLFSNARDARGIPVLELLLAAFVEWAVRV